MQTTRRNRKCLLSVNAQIGNVYRDCRAMRTPKVIFLLSYMDRSRFRRLGGCLERVRYKNALAQKRLVGGAKVDSKIPVSVFQSDRPIVRWPQSPNRACFLFTCLKTLTVCLPSVFYISIWGFRSPLWSSQIANSRKNWHSSTTFKVISTHT